MANAKIKGPIDDEHTFHEPVEGTLAYEDYMSFLEDKGKEMTFNNFINENGGENRYNAYWHIYFQDTNKNINDTYNELKFK